MILALTCACAGMLAAAGQTAPAEQVSVTQGGGQFSLQNAAIGVHWSVTPHGVDGLAVTNRMDGTTITVTSPFAILMQDGTVYNAANLLPAGTMARHAITPRADAAGATPATACLRTRALPGADAGPEAPMRMH